MVKFHGFGVGYFWKKIKKVKRNCDVHLHPSSVWAASVAVFVAIRGRVNMVSKRLRGKTPDPDGVRHKSPDPKKLKHAEKVLKERNRGSENESSASSRKAPTILKGPHCATPQNGTRRKLSFQDSVKVTPISAENAAGSGRPGTTKSAAPKHLTEKDADEILANFSDPSSDVLV